ncbi:MAG: DUF1553 domain-containing protein [Planctomycetota bacterium]
MTGLTSTGLGGALAFLVFLAAAPAQDADALSFFESKVRPVLAQRCVKCHGAKTQKSELRLDHGTFVRKGGARGPAVVPGDADASRLIVAVRYDDVDLQMPPKGKLAADEIAALERWVALGAPWPDEPEPGVASERPAFDLEARRAQHWCWQPRRSPAVPAVQRLDWPRDPLDMFVLAGLESAGLAPAADADTATWLRRATFDVIGLPPLPRDLDALLAHDTPDARATVIDGLLASPHYGERWARHWLDLVRYAETLGHEYDFAIPDAWRYRDYLVRAFNQDVPYDRLVQEHLAGDLLPEPRLHADGFDESPIGTCFFWFGDQTHSPLDPRQHRADRIDNQIDVFGKTFLGLTVACARCHDHKFDAIAQRDYYALAGVLKSSRYALTPLLPLGGHGEALAALRGLRPRLAAHVKQVWQREAAAVPSYLEALAALPPMPRRRDKEGEQAFASRREAFDAERDELARRRGLSPTRLRAWQAAVPAHLAKDRTHPMQAWAAARGEGDFAARWRELRGDVAAARARPTDAHVLADFQHDDCGAWFRIGEAFGSEPQASDLVAVDGEARPVVRARAGRWARSGSESLRLQGSLSSRTFRIDRRYLWLRAAGENCRINIVVEGFNVIRDPIYGPLKLALSDERGRFYRVDLDMWRGLDAYLQVQDLRTADPSDETDYAAPGWIALQEAWLSDAPETPGVGGPPASVALLGDVDLAAAELAAAYGAAIHRAVAQWEPDRAAGMPPAEAGLLSFLSRHHLLDGEGDDPFLRLVAGVDSAIAEVPCVPAMSDGDGLDEHVFTRGDHRSPGERAPRCGLTALGSDAARYRQGSGRLALARELTATDNPLVARVLVNRVWAHLFGRGLVPTVDNFGVLGEAPAHGKLLDRLAEDFVADGWSIKRLLRRLLLSRTYGLSSRTDDAGAEETDATLALLHRARVRRLDGEALRDALLQLAGTLDRSLYGHSVAVHLTPFMDGRGRPDRSGPLDGDGRRSLYQEVRRNFLNPLFLAFDTPIPFSTVGQRNVSNVPAQALALMNDPFVVEQTEKWAERVLNLDLPDRSARVERMLRTVFARAPRADEIDAAETFLLEQATLRDADLDALAPWADLAHALVNVKEFAFLR